MKQRFLYGPVPSRRLGRSLGLDLVPYKVCSYDCIYCQLGRTKTKTVERKPYNPIGEILDQLYETLEKGVHADYISLAGSGEPTLNSDMGPLIHDIKKHTDIPVAVLTNGSLLGDSRVQESIMEADVVLPSLDAYDQRGFETINRPHPDISFKTMAQGLVDFRKVYSGEIWLEVFILENVNATETDAAHFRQWIERVDPQKVHVNTAVRPSAEPHAQKVSQEKMARFCRILGEKAEVIAPFEDLHKHETKTNIEQDILNLLARRPCTLDDISSGLAVHKNEVIKYMDLLLKDDRIKAVNKDAAVYYQLRDFQ
ncbi:MAG: radical SAM protein [Thermodesulfobacteriota bacterium]|nr:radical SAM protein [Thermodesulfobacteriota bacterium]